jgi:hypothetical protein
MTNPATPADVEARWRPLTAPETTVATTLLEDAWRMLSRDYKAAAGTSLDDAMAADPDLSPEVVRILANAVMRVLKNPDGLTQEQIDDYSYQRSDRAASGDLFIDDDDLAALLGLADTPGRAFSVDMLSDYESRWL